MLRIVLVADILLYREGLCQLLGRESGIDVIASVATSRDAIALVGDLQPDVALIDVAIPESRELVAHCQGLARPIPVVAIGLADAEDAVLPCVRDGVAGYVTRDASVKDLIGCVESVARGDFPCSPRIAGSLRRLVAAFGRDSGGTPALARLTDREREIADLIDRGLSNKAISARLHIEVATVKNHVHNLLEKLQVHRRSEAAAKLRGRLLPERPIAPASGRQPA